MKTVEEIQARLEYLYSQYMASIREEKWTASAMFRREIQTLEWVLDN